VHILILQNEHINDVEIFIPCLIFSIIQNQSTRIKKGYKVCWRVCLSTAANVNIFQSKFGAQEAKKVTSCVGASVYPQQPT